MHWTIRSEQQCRVESGVASPKSEYVERETRWAALDETVRGGLDEATEVIPPRMR